ncbi:MULTISPECIES: hypothetical protein [unclassified Paenibacillus]|uniref:hypothetical protein n=1 Tax=unclassified Paenibacillus TaxID=185978 RepID=UPI0036D208FB
MDGIDNRLGKPPSGIPEDIFLPGIKLSFGSGVAAANGNGVATAEGSRVASVEGNGIADDESGRGDDGFEMSYVFGCVCVQPEEAVTISKQINIQKGTLRFPFIMALVKKGKEIRISFPLTPFIRLRRHCLFSARHMA